MTRIIENTTASPVEVQDIGITVPANGTYDLQYKPSSWIEQSDDLVTLITGGTLKLIKNEDPLSYYTVDQAIRVITKNTDVVLAGGNTGEVLSTDGSLTWSDIGIDGYSPLGHIMSVVFIDEDTCKNKWLAQYGDGRTPSNETPYVCPWRCKLNAITFSNQNDDADVDIKIYRAPENDGNNDSLFYTWSLRNARTARKTDFDGTYILEAGDKVGVFVSDQGHNARQPVITVYLQVIGETVADVSEQWWGNF